MEPKIVEGQKVFTAGNFATGEVFGEGVEEMRGKVEAAKGEGGKSVGRWKGGYRRYRVSGLEMGSGFLGRAW